MWRSSKILSQARGQVTCPAEAAAAAAAEACLPASAAELAAAEAEEVPLAAAAVAAAAAAATAALAAVAAAAADAELAPCSSRGRDGSFIGPGIRNQIAMHGFLCQGNIERYTSSLTVQKLCKAQGVTELISIAACIDMCSATLCIASQSGGQQFCVPCSC